MIGLDEDKCLKAYKNGKLFNTISKIITIVIIFILYICNKKYNFYNSSSNAFIKTEKQAPSWWGSPWDYSQPAASEF